MAYEPFISTEDAIKNESDIHSVTEVVQLADRRLCVGDTDEGRRMKENIEEIKQLLEAYRTGEIKEKI